VLLLKFGRGAQDQTQETLRAFTYELEAMPKGTVLLLAELADAQFSAPLAAQWQEIQDLIDDRCSKIAAVGLHGIVASAAHIFLQVARAAGHLTPGKVRFFDEARDARAWLVGDLT
jgi:hypothetical protein